MRYAGPAALALLLACGSDPADPGSDAPGIGAGPPVLTFLCNDATPDDALFASHFLTLEIVDAGTGRPGYPDAELGSRFSRKASLALRGEVLAPLDVFVCVRSLGAHQILLSGLHSAAPPDVLVPLGVFPRDRYVLQVRRGTTLLRSLPFASE